MSIGTLSDATPRHRRRVAQEMAKVLAGAFEHALEARKLASCAELTCNVETGDAGVIRKRALSVWELDELVKLPDAADAAPDGPNLFARLGALCLGLVRVAHLIVELHDSTKRVLPLLDAVVEEARLWPGLTDSPLALPLLMPESSTEMVLDYVRNAATEILLKPDEELWGMQVIAFDASDPRFSDSEDEVDEGGDIGDDSDEDEDDDDIDVDEEEEMDSEHGSGSDKDSDKDSDGSAAKRQRFAE